MPRFCNRIIIISNWQTLILLYEIIARRKPSDKFMERAEMAGMFILFALLIWANMNDVIRFLF